MQHRSPPCTGWVGYVQSEFFTGIWSWWVSRQVFIPFVLRLLWLFLIFLENRVLHFLLLVTFLAGEWCWWWHLIPATSPLIVIDLVTDDLTTDDFFSIAVKDLKRTNHGLLSMNCLVDIMTTRRNDDMSYIPYMFRAGRIYVSLISAINDRNRASFAFPRRDWSPTCENFPNNGFCCNHITNVIIVAIIGRPPRQHKRIMQDQENLGFNGTETENYIFVVFPPRIVCHARKSQIIWFFAAIWEESVRIGSWARQMLVRIFNTFNFWHPFSTPLIYARIKWIRIKRIFKSRTTTSRMKVHADFLSCGNHQN